MGSNWSEPMGGCDSDGNPVTVSFGSGAADNETLLGDGDRSGVSEDGSHHTFHESQNHDHYGSGNGPNNNGTTRGQYTGRGSGNRSRQKLGRRLENPYY